MQSSNRLFFFSQIGVDSLLYKREKMHFEARLQLVISPLQRKNMHSQASLQLAISPLQRENMHSKSSLQLSISPLQREIMHSHFKWIIIPLRSSFPQYWAYKISLMRGLQSQAYFLLQMRGLYSFTWLRKYLI